MEHTFSYRPTDVYTYGKEHWNEGLEGICGNFVLIFHVMYQ
jgi:hypothetical protein